jgi:hypothetical protein
MGHALSHEAMIPTYDLSPSVYRYPKDKVPKDLVKSVNISVINSQPDPGSSRHSCCVRIDIERDPNQAEASQAPSPHHHNVHISHSVYEIIIAKSMMIMLTYIGGLVSAANTLNGHKSNYHVWMSSNALLLRGTKDRDDDHGQGEDNGRDEGYEDYLKALLFWQDDLVDSGD